MDSFHLITDLGFQQVPRYCYQYGNAGGRCKIVSVQQSLTIDILRFNKPAEQSMTALFVKIEDSSVIQRIRSWEDFNKLPRNKVISYYNSVAIMNSTFDFRPIGEIIISSV